jgi:hypothetical protein
MRTFFQKLLIAMLIGSIFTGTIDFKQYDIDAQPIDLHWCGPSRDTVFVVTELNSLYRSDDRGFSWKKLNDILTNTGKNELEQNDNEVRFIVYPLGRENLKNITFPG